MIAYPEYFSEHYREQQIVYTCSSESSTVAMSTVSNSEWTTCEGHRQKEPGSVIVTVPCYEPPAQPNEEEEQEFGGLTKEQAKQRQMIMSNKVNHRFKSQQAFVPDIRVQQRKHIAHNTRKR